MVDVLVGQLAARRRVLRMSQAQLAAASGVPQSEISRIERGRTRPSIDRLRRLADALGVSLTLAAGESRVLPEEADGRPIGALDQADQPERSILSVPSGPEWDAVIAAAVRLQRLLPDATLVGGTAASVYVRHRISHDADHVLGDLRDRFDSVRAELEAAVGWQTARVTRPVQILGSLDGIETGIRQLRRSAPLETQEIETDHGTLRLPTRAEILRIKAFLVVDRNATRDYLDVAALWDGMSLDAALDALALMDALYPQSGDPGAVRQQLIRQLADPRPYDLDEIRLVDYKGLATRWTDWPAVVEACTDASAAMLRAIADGTPGWTDLA
jgi:transcriptional regulator with XRE-family HTH domain